ncbi:MAG: sulfatase-like hydrolase/transferase, partial [bacterium]|nr:sulfatase-like hydrolase/transferase [bacterium]
QYLGKWEETPGFQEKRKGYIVSETPKATFAAMVSHLDRDVGSIVELVEELGIADNTVIIFTSDNGAQSRYDVNEEFFNASGPLRGYKGAMYEGGLRVPLIVRWPGKITPGSVTDHPTYFPDYMPTLAELAGVAAPGVTDGISILPTLLGTPEDQQTQDWMYWELVDREGNFTRRAARHGDWKFVQQGPSEALELFNLADDLGEQNDVAAQQPDVIAQFESWFKANRTPARTWQDIALVSIDDYVR